MSRKEFDVLVVGELNVDLILDRLENFPSLGRETIAERMLLTLGSSSAIFASNLSVLGSKVCFCGRIGRDNFGDKILTDLAAKGVSTEHIIRSESADTGITVIMNVDEDRAMVTYPGAMNELTIDDISDELIASARHLHVSSAYIQPGLKPGLAALFSKARRLGLTTSIDPQWDPREQWELDTELLKAVDVFLPNIEELKNFSRQSSIPGAIASLSDKCRMIVVKKGNEGAEVWTAERSFSQPAFINKNVADAIGAGDSFNAGFIHLFVQNKPLNECLRFGALCGAINTTRSGGTTAFADRKTAAAIAREKFNCSL